MDIVREMTEDSVALPPGMPQIPGVIYLCTGMDPGEAGIYGPIWRETYTRGGTEVDLLSYTYDGQIHVPELEGIIPLSNFLGALGGGMLYFSDPGSWGGIHLCIRGRQRDGIICPTHYHKARDDLQRTLERKLGVEVLRTEELWSCSGVPPDLLVRKDGHRFV